MATEREREPDGGRGRLLRRALAAAGAVCLAGAVLFFFRPPSSLVPGFPASAGAGAFVVHVLAFAGAYLLVWGAAGAWVRRAARRAAEALGRPSERRFVAVLFLLALAFRMFFALGFSGRDLGGGDAACYHSRAVWLLEGKGYVRPGPVVDGRQTFVPSAYWPVGYPVFLVGLYSLTGVDPRVGIAANAVLSAAAVVVLYWIGRAMFGVGVARLAALALCAYVRQMPASLLSATLFTLLMLLAVLVAVRAPLRWYWAGAAGLAGMAATFVRSNGALLVGVLFFVWWGRSRSVRRAAWLAAMMAAVAAVGPCLWAARNARELGVAAPLSLNGGDMLLLGANDRATGVVPYDAFVSEGPYAKVRRLRVDEFDEAGSYRLAKTLAVAWIRAHPFRWLGLGVVKVGWMTVGTSGWHHRLRWLGRTPVPRWLDVAYRLFERVSYWLVLVGLAVYAKRAVAGAGEIIGRRDFVPLLPLLLFGYFAAQCFVFAALPRYRLPVEPLMLLAAVAALCGWRRPGGAAAGQFEPLE